MVYPLLPLFMIGVLGSSKTQLGAMEGGAVLIVAMMSAVAGIRSDRKDIKGGRVWWIRWGYGLPVLGKAIIAVATVWPLVLGGRLLDRFGKGLRGAPRDALITDAVSPDQREKASEPLSQLVTGPTLRPQHTGTVGISEPAVLRWSRC